MIHVNGWPDQTAMEAKNEPKLLSYVGRNLDANDLKKGRFIARKVRNRTGSVTSELEMLNAASSGMKPDVHGILWWTRQARVADTVAIPAQLHALAESSIRLGHLAKPSGAGFMH